MTCRFRSAFLGFEFLKKFLFRRQRIVTRQILYKTVSCRLVGSFGYFGLTGCEEFLFLQLDAFPRRIAEHHVKSAVFHNIAEFEMPVKEAVFFCQLADRVLDISTAAVRSLDSETIEVFGIWDIAEGLLCLLCEIRSDEQIGTKFLPGAGFALTRFAVDDMLVLYVDKRFFRHVVEVDLIRRNFGRTVFVKQFSFYMISHLVV